MGGGDRAGRAATRCTCDGRISIALVSLTTCDPNCGRKENRTAMPSSAKMALHDGLLVDRFARGGARDNKHNWIQPRLGARRRGENYQESRIVTSSWHVTSDN